MNTESSTGARWQVIAIDLLRGLAGVAPTLSIEELRSAGAQHGEQLLRVGMDGPYFAVCHPDHPRQRLYQALWTAQTTETRAVLDSSRALGVEPIVIKGIEVGARYRPAHGIGVSGDIDLLVPAAALWSIEQVMYGSGYARGGHDLETGEWREAAPLEAFRSQALGYELVPFVKEIPIDGVDDAILDEARRFPMLFTVRDRAVCVAIRFDIHHNVLFNFDVRPLLSRTIGSALGVGRALNLADQLWFLIHRYYFEVASGTQIWLRVLALIAAAVSDPAIDWPAFIGNAVACNTTAPCLYWLTFFRRLGVATVPESVLGKLRSHNRHSERNWGWQLGRLLDVDEPFPDELLAL